MKNQKDFGENPYKIRKNPKAARRPVTAAKESRPGQSCYTGFMVDELEFRSLAETALNSLLRHLIVREEDAEAGFEVDEQNGVLNLAFDKPPGKFVITPNAPMRQIWISALSTSFKLDWGEAASAFILPRTGEKLEPLVDRLIGEHLAAWRPPV